MDAPAPYQYQEYPKALYREGAYLAVTSLAEEDAARADGYDDWAADQATHAVIEHHPSQDATASTSSAPAGMPKMPKKGKVA